MKWCSVSQISSKPELLRPLHLLELAVDDLGVA